MTLHSESDEIRKAFVWLSVNEPNAGAKAQAGILLRLLDADPAEVASLILVAKDAGLGVDKRKDAMLALFAKAMEG